MVAIDSQPVKSGEALAIHDWFRQQVKPSKKPKCRYLEPAELASAGRFAFSGAFAALSLGGLEGALSLRSFAPEASSAGFAPLSSSSSSRCFRCTSELGAEQRNFICSSRSIYCLTRPRSPGER